MAEAEMLQFGNAWGDRGARLHNAGANWSEQQERRKCRTDQKSSSLSGNWRGIKPAPACSSVRAKLLGGL